MRRGGFLLFASLNESLKDTFSLVKPEDLPFKPPYKPARLVNEDKPLSERWYIVFWVWDAAQKQLIRRRDYKVNKFDSVKERKKYAATEIKGLNELLKAGYHVNAKVKAAQAKKPTIMIRKDFTVKLAFDFVLTLVKATKRPATYNTYSSCSNLFTTWFEYCYAKSLKISFLHKSHIVEYLDFVQVDRTLNNRSRNGYLGHIKTLLGLMVERDIIPHNPAVGIREEPEDIGGNTAYLPEQVATLKTAITEENYRLWLFIQFIFYGFIRPGEIGRIRIKFVNLESGKIFLPGNITKNRKPRHVQLSPAFKKYILEMNLGAYDPEHFVFGHNLVTGPMQLQKNYASALHTKIARKLKFGLEYTLYSWKHTGVIMHYLAGIDIKTLQNQLGHWSLQETDTYLKSLGVFDNQEFELKSPSI